MCSGKSDDSQCSSETRNGSRKQLGVGYSEASKYGEDILDVITREAEDCDSFEVAS